MSWDLALTGELLLHFKDRNGKHATSRYNIDNAETDPLSGGAGAISDAAQALSDAALFATEIIRIATNTTPPTFGTTPYDSTGDKAAYRFKAGDGTTIHIQIGNPLENNFSDGWDLDPTNVAVAAFITAFQDNAVSEGGNSSLVFAGGTRRRPPRLKKL